MKTAVEEIKEAIINNRPIPLWSRKLVEMKKFLILLQTYSWDKANTEYWQKQSIAWQQEFYANYKHEFEDFAEAKSESIIDYSNVANATELSMQAYLLGEAKLEE